MQYEDKSEHPNSSEMNRQAYTEGCGFYDMEDFARAKSSFETALEYWPEDPKAWFALGNCHDAMDKPSKAEICYRMSLKFSGPDARPNVSYNLANSLFDQQMYQKAIDCYSEIGDDSRVFAAAQKNMALAKSKLH